MKFLLFASAFIAARLMAQNASIDPASIDQRVAECQPTKEERRIDDIGWAGNLTEAQNLAREHNRPVFLFTHDGRMGIGRC
ncbi:MAG: hypothetical protein ACR2OZ_03230 [Verrucomicrobiales bacterium]